MRKKMFKDLPAVKNKNRPGGREPITYVWVTNPETAALVDNVPVGLVIFRRAW